VITPTATAPPVAAPTETAKKPTWALVGAIVVAVMMVAMTIGFRPINVKRVQETYNTKKEEFIHRYERDYGNTPSQGILDYWIGTTNDDMNAAFRAATKLDKRNRMILIITYIIGWPLIIGIMRNNKIFWLEMAIWISATLTIVSIFLLFVLG